MLTYMITLCLFAASPGPGVFAVIGQSIARGPAQAFLMLTGIIIGDIFYLIATVAGLGLLAAKMGVIFALVKYLGAAYLIWLGWQNWRRKKILMDGSAKAAHQSLLGGFAISISNPKVMVFYLAFLPTLLDVSAISVSDVAVLASITTVVSYVILSVYIFGAARLKKTITKPRPQRWFNRLSGTMMAGAGFFVAIRS